MNGLPTRWYCRTCGHHMDECHGEQPQPECDNVQVPIVPPGTPPEQILALLPGAPIVYTRPAATTYHDEPPFIMHFPEWYVVVPRLANGSRWLPPGVMAE